MQGTSDDAVESENLARAAKHRCSAQGYGMRRQWTFTVTALIVALVTVWAVTDRTASSDRMATGTVDEVHPGDWMLVTNGGMKLPVALRQTTTYDGDPAALATGARVTVWYRNLAERRMVANRVRILAGAPSR